MKVTFDQVKRLSNGEHVDKVINKCDWDRADLVEALALRVIASKRELEDYRERVRSRTGLKSPEIPDGWKLVPIEPTVDMVEMGGSKCMKGKDWSRAQQCWAEMLRLAPKPEM